MKRRGGKREGRQAEMKEERENREYYELLMSLTGQDKKISSHKKQSIMALSSAKTSQFNRWQMARARVLYLAC